MCDYFVALISVLVLLKCGNSRITSSLNIDWIPPTVAIYGMRITSLHFVVLHTFL